MDLNKLLLVEQHFYSNGHDFSKDSKFTIIKRLPPPKKTTEKPKTKTAGWTIRAIMKI